MDYFKLAHELGIHHETAQKFIPHTEVNGKIVLDLQAAEASLAQDAAMVTAPNIGAPAALYTYIDPRIIPILFAAQNSTKFFGDQKIGDWTDEYITFMTEEIAGQVGPYNDYGNGPTSDANVNFATRDNFRYQTSIKYGDLELEKMAKAKVNLAASKQRAAAEILARARNKFNLYGVAGMSIYGMLNDPNLNTPIAPVADANNKTKWADKIAANPDAAANIVYNDLNALLSELTANNGGLIDANAEIVVGISNKMWTYLTIPNSFGKTAMALFKENYPNAEFVQLPELSTASGEMVYMTVRSLLGQDTGAAAFSAAMRFGRLKAELSHFEQKATAATSGAVIFRPSLVQIMQGV